MKKIVAVICLATLAGCSTLKPAATGALMGVTGGPVAINYVSEDKPVSNLKYHLAIAGHAAATAGICAFNPIFCGMWFGYNALVGGVQFSK